MPPESPTIDVMLSSGTPITSRASPSLRSPLLALAKFRWRWLSVLLAGLVLSVLAARSARPIYTSEAVILVRQSTADALSENPNIRELRPTRTATEDYLSVQLSVLQSRDLREALARRLLEKGIVVPVGQGSEEDPGPYEWRVPRPDGRRGDGDEGRGGGARLAPSREQRAAVVPSLVSLFKRRIEVENEARSPLITVQCAHEEPEVARQVVSELLDVYEEVRRDMYSLAPALDAIERDYQTAQAGHRGAEEALSEYRAMQGVFDPVLAEANLRAQRDDILADQMSAEVRLHEARARARQLTGVLATLPRELEWASMNPQRNPVWLDLAKKRDEVRLRVLESEYAPASAEHKALLKQQQFLEGRLREEPEHVPPGELGNRANPQYVQAEGQAREAKVEIEATTAHLEEAAKRLKAIEAGFARLAPLRDPYALLVDRVEEAQTRREECKRNLDEVEREKNLVDAKILVSQRVIQQPTSPPLPVSGGPRRLILIGTALSLMAAGVVGILSGLLDRTVRAPRELRAVRDVGVVATIPDLSKRRNVAAFTRRYGKIAGSPSYGPSAADLGCLDLCQGSLTNQVDRIVRAAVGGRIDAQGGSPVMIVICGSTAEEGASTIAVNVACRLSAEGTVRVLLVDANPESRAPRPRIGADSEPDSVPISASNVPGLALAAPDLGPGSHGVLRLLDDVEGDYDAVVIDAGPLTTCAQTLELLEPEAKICLVVRADSTRLAMIDEAWELVRRSPATLVGAVLNRRNYYLPRWLGDEA